MANQRPDGWLQLSCPGKITEVAGLPIGYG